MKVRQGFVSNSSTSSFVLIGIPISQEIYTEKFFTKEKERNCECFLPDGLDITVLPKCPMCGRTAMTERLVPKDGQEFGEIKLGKFPIQEILDEMLDESAFVILPDSYQKGDEYEENFSLIPDDLFEMKQELKEVLGPLGLWDESKFGVWSGSEYNR